MNTVPPDMSDDDYVDVYCDVVDAPATACRWGDAYFCENCDSTEHDEIG